MAILGFAVGSLSYKFELWQIILTYLVVPMSTTKVVMQIISTFVGYNILLILIVQPIQRESCSSLKRKKHTSLQCITAEAATAITMATMNDER